MRQKILLLHNIIAPYRTPIFEFLNKEFDLHVLYCQAKTSDRKWNASLEGVSFEAEILPHYNKGPFCINPTLNAKLNSIVPDVYMFGDNPPNFFSSLKFVKAAKKNKKPLIIWSEVTGTEYYTNNEFKQFLIFFYKLYIRMFRKFFLYPYASAFVAYGQHAKNFLVTQGIAERKIFSGIQVIPKKLLDKPLKKKSEKKIIFTMCYLEKRKGVHDLIKAYKQLNPKDTELIIAGTGSEEQTLKELAADRSDIIFLGYVDGKSKVDCYSNADIFVLPTYQDPWGLVVNEAIYYGLPIITTTNAGASDMIVKKKNGFVIKSGNIHQLKACLDTLLSNDKLRKSMQQKSKNFLIATDVKTGVKPFAEAIKFVLRKK